MAGTDRFEWLSEIGEVPHEVFDRWLEQARANKRRLDGCARHQFFSRTPAEGSPFGKSFTCLKCGGAMNFMSIGKYIDGFKAAGGDPNDIWPGWE